VSREQGAENRTASQKGLKGFVGLGLAPIRCVDQHDYWQRETSHSVWIIFGFRCLSVVLTGQV